MSNTYSAQLIHLYDRDDWTVSTDHCYARPWNWRPETSFLRPTKTLFIPKSACSRSKPINPLAPSQDVVDVIDIETVAKVPCPIYDIHKAKNLMEECEKYAASIRVNDIHEDWEENISRDLDDMNQLKKDLYILYFRSFCEVGWS
ncbi:hypothetical protein NQ315_002511 [Exocentrus adspersus]|uniref:Uncharacterized protein n=1 Tax=Exocentrus adspersus TaxID=1586481 RepID=A0AAV8VL15_9CUCU|nr:hypothetical protein NQ315_002511 [Exocentrus adspersus]